jgi:6-phosphofructo-2-kinase/fructose-2,6-biphosphatase 4
MVAPLYTTDSGLLFHAGKILILTVGLPARGKTHISRALERYLRWMGVKTQVVSLGDYRRKTIGGAQKLPSDYFTLGEFLVLGLCLCYFLNRSTDVLFPTGEKSPETLQLRKTVAEGCEKLIWNFFDGGGQVVIYDANNGSRTSRQCIAEKFDKKKIHVIYLGESTRLFRYGGMWCLTLYGLQKLFAIIRKSSRLISEMSRYLLLMCVMGITAWDLRIDG